MAQAAAILSSGFSCFHAFAETDPDHSVRALVVMTDAQATAASSLFYSYSAVDLVDAAMETAAISADAAIVETADAS